MNISFRQKRLAILLRHSATNLVFLKVKLAKKKITTNSQDQRTAGFEVTCLKSDVFSTYGVSFDATDNVYNVLTMKVLPKKDAEQFLTVKEIGKESYISFVKERIEGESSIWDTIKKIKIPCFTNNSKSTSVKLMVKHYKYGKNASL